MSQSDRRRHPIGMDPVREARREQAEERRISREGRSDAEQIARLDERPGRSARERARIAASRDGSAGG